MAMPVITEAGSSVLGAFGPRRAKDDPMAVPLELPPLPTLARSVMVDPGNRRMGEQLVTQTFFAYGTKPERKPKAPLVGIEVSKEGEARLKPAQVTQ